MVEGFWLKGTEEASNCKNEKLKLLDLFGEVGELLTY